MFEECDLSGMGFTVNYTSQTYRKTAGNAQKPDILSVTYGAINRMFPPIIAYIWLTLITRLSELFKCHFFVLN